MRLLTKRYGYMVSIALLAVMIVWFVENRRETMVPMDTSREEVSSVAPPGVPATSAYLPYNPELITRAKDRPVVLFFHASWCPYCRALDSDIAATIGTDTSKILILKVDYDNSGPLKKLYGVTTQHTLVEVDEGGALVAKWTGSATLVDIVSKLK